MANETPYHPSTIYIEDAANAVGFIEKLKRETRLPIVAGTQKGSKISRMEAQTGLFEAANVLLPNERVLPAAWLLDFEREIQAVPNVKHDDTTTTSTRFASPRARHEKDRLSTLLDEIEHDDPRSDAHWPEDRAVYFQTAAARPAPPTAPIRGPRQQ